MRKNSPKVPGGLQPFRGKGDSMPLNATNVGRKVAARGLASTLRTPGPKRMMGVKGGRSPVTPRGMINR